MRSFLIKVLALAVVLGGVVPSLALANEEPSTPPAPDQAVCALTYSGDHTPEECGADPSLRGCEWEQLTFAELEDDDIYFVLEEGKKCKDKRRAGLLGLPLLLLQVGGAAAAAVVVADVVDDTPARETREASPFAPGG